MRNNRHQATGRVEDRQTASCGQEVQHIEAHNEFYRGIAARAPVAGSRPRAA
jgi:hypothetical protein